MLISGTCTYSECQTIWHTSWNKELRLLKKSFVSIWHLSQVQAFRFLFYRSHSQHLLLSSHCLHVSCNMFIHRDSCTSTFVRAFAMCNVHVFKLNSKSGFWKQVHDCQFSQVKPIQAPFFENFESFSKSSCCDEAGGESETVKPEAPGQRARDSDLSQHLWWKFAVTLYYILLSCGESAAQPDQCNNPTSPCQKVCRPFPYG